jgi:hypothetical protein
MTGHRLALVPYARRMTGDRHAWTPYARRMTGHRHARIADRTPAATHDR